LFQEIFHGMVRSNGVAAHTRATLVTFLAGPGHAQGRDCRDGPVMDRGGIATEETPADNLAGIRTQGYIDRVVSRSPTRVFDPDVDISVGNTTVTTAGPEEISVSRDRMEDQHRAGRRTRLLIRRFSCGVIRTRGRG